MPWSAIRFEIHLTDKCNLNCAGCIHFSSLCDDLQFLDIYLYEKDCKRISELSRGVCADIRILGGEPLLHPNVNSFLEITRKYFPVVPNDNRYGIIELVTNGILLPKQRDSFWQCCKDNNIRVVVSDYPIRINNDFILQKADKFGVDLKMYSDKIDERMTGSANQWAKIPIDIHGSQDVKKSFGECFLAGSCFQLVNGRIYKCARIAYINYFNKTFNQDLKTELDDYIDIYEAKSIEEILDKLTMPAQFCRYCDIQNTTWNNPWMTSKKIIDEYL